MKLLTMILILVTALVSLPSVAKKIDYKCYVDTTQGKKVMFYRWNETDKTKGMASIVATKVTLSGKTLYVKSAIECVPLSDNFTNIAAQQLDKTTLR